MSAPAVSLRASGRVRRRKLANHAAEALATLAALAAVAILALVVVSVFRRGATALSLDFFTKPAAVFGQAGGGIAPALVGSLVLVALATAFTVPVAVLVALYAAEFAPPRLARAIRLLLDVLNGIPSIVTGIFVFALVVATTHSQSALTGALALAIVMLPLVARATGEVLALAPPELREAGLALGASRSRTVLGIVLPTSIGGILTGTTLAVARAAGETAPLLFTSSIAANAVSWDPRQALNSIPVTIFTYSEAPDPALHAQAWAAAFILITFVLATSLAARLLLARSRRRHGRPE